MSWFFYVVFLNNSFASLGFAFEHYQFAVFCRQIVNTSHMGQAEASSSNELVSPPDGTNTIIWSEKRNA